MPPQSDIMPPKISTFYRAISSISCYAAATGLTCHLVQIGFCLYFSIRYDGPFWETADMGSEQIIMLLFNLLANSAMACLAIAGPRAAYGPIAGNIAAFLWIMFCVVLTWFRYQRLLPSESDLRDNSTMVILCLVWYWVGYALEWKFGCILYSRDEPDDL